jgi:hypothetical protein
VERFMSTKRLLALVASILITFFLTFFVDRVFVLEQGAPPSPAHVAQLTAPATGSYAAPFEPAA